MSLHVWQMRVREAEEKVRLAGIEVKDSVRELGHLQSEWLRLSCLVGFEESAIKTILDAEIQRVKDELIYAKEEVQLMDAHLASIKASILGGNRG